MNPNNAHLDENARYFFELKVRTKLEELRYLQAINPIPDGGRGVNLLPLEKCEENSKLAQAEGLRFSGFEFNLVLHIL